MDSWFLLPWRAAWLFGWGRCSDRAKSCHEVQLKTSEGNFQLILIINWTISNFLSTYKVLQNLTTRLIWKCDWVTQLPSMVRHLVLIWIIKRSRHRNWCKILNNSLQHLDQILKLNFWCKSDAQLHSENFIDWEGAFKKNWCCCAKQHIYLRTKLKLRIRMWPLCDGIARSGRWRREESLDSLNSGNGKCKHRSNIVNISHWVVLRVMPPWER